MSTTAEAILLSGWVLACVAFVVSLYLFKEEMRRMGARARRLERNRDFWRRAYTDEHEFEFKWPQR